MKPTSARAQFALDSLKNVKPGPAKPEKAGFELAAEEVTKMMEAIHKDWWFPDLVINESPKCGWTKAKQKYPDLCSAILEKFDEVDNEYERHTRKESTWEAVQDAVIRYQKAWESLEKEMMGA